MVGNPGQRSVVRVVSMCRFAEAMGIGMLIPILPLFLQTLPTSDRFGNLGPEKLTAVLYGATGLGIATVQIFAGRISDRLDRRKAFVIAGLILGSCCSALFPLVGSFQELLAVRLLQGICLGFTFAPMMAIIAYHATPGQGGRILGTYSTIRLIGFSLGPLLGAWLSDLGGYAWTFRGSAILLGISVVAVAIWVPEHRDPRSPSDRRRVPGMFYLVSSTVFLMMIGVSVVISLFPYYERELGATAKELALCYGAFVASRCLFQYFCGWLGDRLDKKRMLVAAMIMFIPVALAQGYVDDMRSLIMVRVVLGVVAAAITTCASGISAERAEKGMRASTMSTNTLAFSLGVSVGPMIGGWIAEPGSPLPFIITAAGATVVTVALVLSVPSDRAWRASRSPA